MENTALTSLSPDSTVANREVDSEAMQKIADRMGLAYFDPRHMKGLRELGEAVMETDPKILSLGTLTFSQQDMIRSATELREYLREVELVEDKLAIHKTLIAVHHELATNIAESRELADSIAQGRGKRPVDRSGSCFRPGQKVEATQIIINQRINESARENESVSALPLPNGSPAGARPTHSTTIECGVGDHDGAEHGEGVATEPAQSVG